jgi:dTMP kinase
VSLDGREHARILDTVAAVHPGRLITVEGLDGAGKSTLIAGLVPALRERRHDVEVLREPGGVDLAERIRTLVKDPQLSVPARAEALLYAAARAALVEERIRPALAAGRWVLLDRFVDSSLAYQGAGRRLGVEAVAELNAFATGGLRPDRTLLLHLDPEERRRRLSDRGEAADRLEQEPDAFFATIAAAYDALAAGEPERFTVLDAARSPEVLVVAALEACESMASGSRESRAH